MEGEDPGVLALGSESTRRFHVWNSIIVFLVFFSCGFGCREKEGMYKTTQYLDTGDGWSSFGLMLIIGKLAEKTRAGVWIDG